MVAAFDNEQEFAACMEGVQEEIRRRREAGEPVDRGEHVSGHVHEPGYLHRAANAHLLKRAVKHGLTGRWLTELDLPSSMSVARAERR